jgi:hypothetical protein
MPSGDGYGGAINVFTSLPYNGWLYDDPFAADVLGAGGSVLGSCEGKLGIVDFSYEHAHPLTYPFIYCFNLSPAVI